MITRALALNGARRVYVIGRRADVLQEVARSINPSIVIPLPGDVTSQSSLSEMAARVHEEIGLVNLVVANAGIMGPRPLRADSCSVAEYRSHALKTSMEDFTNTYAVNATSVYYTALAFLELLDAGNKTNSLGIRSQIVATSSIGGFSRLSGASFAYSSSKAAVTHMMKMMATAFVPFRIRCNVLAPGLVESELAGGIISKLSDGGSSGGIDEKVIPAGRTGTDEDIAGAILYMASKAGAYLNGSVIVVDGGRLGMLPSTY
jgi:NAD(P)-dependent dehydrogenase (short-subunit alcohol dehydrogenase family)